MRLFPQPYIGLHPDFYPERVGPILPGESILTSVVWLPASVGAIWLGFGRLWSKSLPFVSACKIVTYGSIGTSIILTYTRILDDDRAATILGLHNIEVPPTKFVDRIGHFDYDDSAVLGGAAGILVAHQLRRPWRVHGLTRYISAFGFGALALNRLHDIRNEFDAERLVHIRKQREQFETARDARANFQNEYIMDTLRKASKTLCVPSPAALSSTPNGPPPRSNGNTASAAFPLRSSTSGELQGTPHLEGIVKTGPHLGQQVPYSDEVHPIASTNYDWTSDNPIEDLEKHIRMLQQRRQQLAREAEVVWSWLSEKEMDYYNTPTNADDPVEKASKLRYIETLGNLHAMTWAEASVYDWVIADSRKRIEQLRSAYSNDGKVTWRAKCSETATGTVPKYALMFLESRVSILKQREEEMHRLKEELAMSMLDPDFDADEDKEIFHPTKQKMVSKREYIADVRETVDEALEESERFRESYLKIMADAHSRGK